MYKKLIVHRFYSFNSAMHLSTSRTNLDNRVLALLISPSLTETTRAVSRLLHLTANSSERRISCCNSDSFSSNNALSLSNSSLCSSHKDINCLTLDSKTAINFTCSSVISHQILHKSNLLD